MKLRDHFEAVLARVDHVDTPELLILGEHEWSRCLIKSLWRKLHLKLTDVVFEHGLESALEIKEGIAAAELETAIQRLFDAFKEMK